jgi:Big-like domain-containing protein
MKRILLPCIILLLGALAGCGGGSKPAPPQASVTVSPTTASVIAGQTQQFTATVSGASNTAVTWSVSGTGCSGTSCGTIDATGMYKAPDLIPATTTVTVTATSVADATRAGTAAITHQCVWVGISPSGSVSLISADTKQFTATVTHAPTGKDAVAWSVTGGGTVDSSGAYSAPAKVTTDTAATLTATSTFDSTKSASVTIALKAPVVAVSPADVTLEAGGAHQQFTATVANVPTGQTSVKWSLNGLGMLSLGGLYTTPDLVSDMATATIQAVPTFDDSKVGKATVTIHPVALVVSPKAASLYATETQQFTATVTNHVNKSVTWAVSGSACAGAACGTVDANGLYSAPSSVASELTVSLVAASVADSSRADTATIMLKPIAVTVSPKAVNVQAGTTKQFSATVQGSSNANVTWSVSGSGCSGNSCGTINSGGLYTAPTTIPVPPTVTITATSVADPARSDAVTVTVINDPQAKLHGAYAFIYTGWDMNGKAQDAIGSMVADGSGHLTGLIDMNGVNTAYRRISETFTGTYQVNATDNRGQMVFTLSTGARTFRFAIDSTGEKGHFILFEETGMGVNRYGSGIFKRQTTSDFSLAKLNGDYAMGMAGMSAFNDERNALVGRLHVDGTGAISNTSLDVNNTDGPAANLTFTGAIAMDSSTGMASGRGTMSVSAIGTNVNFGFYLVDEDEAYMIRTDPIGADVPMFVGGMMKQRGGPFSAASLTGQSVFYMTGVLRQSVVRSRATIGRFDLNNAAGSYRSTTNYAGSVFGGSSSVNITVDPNGRGRWTIAGISDGEYVLYLVAPNTGFLMQYNNPGTSVDFGFFEPQSPGPFNDALLNGEYFGGAIAPATSGVNYGNGLQTWDGNRAWSGTGDNAGPDIGLRPDIPVSGTYVITDSAAGTGNWLLTSQGTYNKKFYVIGPNKIVFVPTEAANVQPTVEVFER